MYHWSQVEKQILYLGGATGGTFTIGKPGDTATLDHDVSAAALQAALEGIFGVGNVTVVGDDDFLITFTLAVGASTLEASFASLTGTTDTPALTETQAYESQTLKILFPTYRPPHADSIYSEIDVIPSAAVSNPVTILQQGGRKRKVVTYRALVTTLAAYESLLTDYHSGANKTFYGPESLVFESIIRNLSPPEYIKRSAVIKFNITFMEES